MTAQRIKKFTLEEYVELERSTNTKYEYHDGEVFALAGGSLNHSILCMNVSGELRDKILSNNKNCFTFNSEMKLNVGTQNKYFYPDAMVVCGDFQQPENFKDAITNPILIAEVLSEKTANYDRGDKFAKYRTIDSFKEYVLIEQNKPSVEIYYRADKNSLWQINYYEGLEHSFPLQSIQIEITMKTLYDRVVFENDAQQSKQNNA